MSSELSGDNVPIQGVGVIIAISGSMVGLDVGMMISGVLVDAGNSVGVALGKGGLVGGKVALNCASNVLFVI